ncbi:hypothetical protein Vafri_10951, partial [Volvox africanus]
LPPPLLSNPGGVTSFGPTSGSDPRVMNRCDPSPLAASFDELCAEEMPPWEPLPPETMTGDMMVVRSSRSGPMLVVATASTLAALASRPSELAIRARARGTMPSLSVRSTEGIRKLARSISVGAATPASVITSAAAAASATSRSAGSRAGNATTVWPCSTAARACATVADWSWR